MEYRLRIVDKLLDNKLKGMGAVLVEVKLGGACCLFEAMTELHGEVLILLPFVMILAPKIAYIEINP